tara:strand:+ start:877 stop:1158 length:282 start_codon:yes stop_codon:yes gene_type:complete
MFKPLNRYVQVKLIEPEPAKTSAGILLPSDYEVKEERFVQATAIAWAPDVRFAEDLTQNSKMIIDKSMVEEVNSYGSVMHLVLDNYILGLIKE